MNEQPILNQGTVTPPYSPQQSTMPVVSNVQNTFGQVAENKMQHSKNKNKRPDPAPASSTEIIEKTPEPLTQSVQPVLNNYNNQQVQQEQYMDQPNPIIEQSNRTR